MDDHSNQSLPKVAGGSVDLADQPGWRRRATNHFKSKWFEWLFVAILGLGLVVLALMSDEKLGGLLAIVTEWHREVASGTVSNLPNQSLRSPERSDYPQPTLQRASPAQPSLPALSLSSPSLSVATPTAKHGDAFAQQKLTVQNIPYNDPAPLPMDGVEYTCRMKNQLGERAAIEHINKEIGKARIPGTSTTLETDPGPPLLQVVAPGVVLRFSVLRGSGADDLLFHFDREGDRKMSDAVLLRDGAAAGSDPGSQGAPWSDDTEKLKDRIAALARNAIRDLAVDPSCVEVHR